MAMGKVRDEGKEAFWRRTVRRQGQSGLTVRAFCREHELRKTAFYFWRRELAQREAAQRHSTTFLPVRVTAAPAQRVTAEVWPAPRH
jgi:transposase-like protein